MATAESVYIREESEGEATNIGFKVYLGSWEMTGILLENWVGIIDVLAFKQ